MNSQKEAYPSVVTADNFEEAKAQVEEYLMQKVENAQARVQIAETEVINARKNADINKVATDFDSLEKAVADAKANKESIEVEKLLASKNLADAQAELEAKQSAYDEAKAYRETLTLVSDKKTDTKAEADAKENTKPSTVVTQSAKLEAKKKTPDTADPTSLGFYAFMLTGSLGLAGTVSYKCRIVDKKNKKK